MGYIPGAGMGGGWGPSGVYTSRHGFKRNTLEGMQSRARYYQLRAKYAGRNPVDLMRFGYWKSSQAGMSPRYWSEAQKIANYVFLGIPGARGKVRSAGLRISRTSAGKQVIKSLGSKKTQRQLEQAMGLKRGIDKRIKRTNPIRKTNYYKNAKPSKKAAIDAAWLTGVWGAARIIWTTGGAKVTSNILGGDWTRRRRYKQVWR